MITLMVVMSLFGLTHPEYMDKVEEQVNKGYTWEYQGYTPWSQEKSLSILIEPEEFPPYILFKLTKPEEDK
tara:strand:+ start:659 stop:871 length:213 start_codon:yes stop_codon:yes gene_type:complete